MQLIKSLATQKQKKKNVNFKMSSDELEMARVRAEKYAGGNLSAFIREAILKYIPPQEDLVSTEQLRR